MVSKSFAAALVACAGVVSASGGHGHSSGAGIGLETFFLFSNILNGGHDHHGSGHGGGGRSLSNLIPLLLTGGLGGDMHDLEESMHMWHSWQIVDELSHSDHGAFGRMGHLLPLMALQGGEPVLEALHDYHVFDEVLNHDGGAHHLLKYALLGANGDQDEFMENMHATHLLSMYSDTSHNNFMPLSVLAGADILNVGDSGLVANAWAIDELFGHDDHYSGSHHGSRHSGHHGGYSHSRHAAPMHYGRRAAPVHYGRRAAPVRYSPYNTVAPVTPYTTVTAAAAGL